MNETNTEIETEEEASVTEPETAENPTQDLSGTDGDLEGTEISTDRDTGASSSRMTVEGETEEEIRPEWVEYDSGKPSKMTIEELNVHYGDDHALKDIGMQIPKNSVTALIGPSGCGKSTYLRCLNRMNDRIRAARIDGDVYLEGENIYDDDADLVELRKRVGMVFQSPNPFPKTIRDNVSYGPRKHGDINKGIVARLTGRDDTDKEEELVERSLKQAALWDEVHDRLDDNALGLSGGQQQRLCIARALATDPEVLLMDEPASALDPIATAKIEDLIDDLSEEYTVVIVTHNMQQAARVSDQTAVFLTGGELVEYGETEQIFENPQSQRVEDYITGKFG